MEDERMSLEQVEAAHQALVGRLWTAVDPIISEWMEHGIPPVERVFLALGCCVWVNKHYGETKHTIPPLVCWRTAAGQSISNSETDAFEFGQFLQRQFKVAHPDLFARVLEGLTRTLEPAPETPGELE